MRLSLSVFWLTLLFIWGCAPSSPGKTGGSELSALYDKELQAQTALNGAMLSRTQKRIAWRITHQRASDANLRYLSQLHLAIEAKRALRETAQDPRASVSALDLMVKASKNATMIKRAARKTKDDLIAEAAKLEADYTKAHKAFLAADEALKRLRNERQRMENETESTFASRAKAGEEKVNDAKRRLVAIPSTSAPTSGPSSSSGTSRPSSAPPRLDNDIARLKEDEDDEENGDDDREKAKTNYKEEENYGSGLRRHRDPHRWRRRSWTEREGEPSREAKEKKTERHYKTSDEADTTTSGNRFYRRSLQQNTKGQTLRGLGRRDDEEEAFQTLPKVSEMESDESDATESDSVQLAPGEIEVPAELLQLGD